MNNANLVMMGKMFALAILAMAMDIAFGYVLAGYRGIDNPEDGIKSSVMRKGGFRKFIMIMVLVVMVALDLGKAWLDIPDTSEIIKAFNAFSFTVAVAGYMILMEIVSVLETVDGTFPEFLPKKVKVLLQQTAKLYGVEVKEEQKE